MADASNAELMALIAEGLLSVSSELAGLTKIVDGQSETLTRIADLIGEAIHECKLAKHDIKKMTGE